MSDNGLSALDGVKVVDWTQWQFGPVAATMLGDLGAEVLKVEALDGDPGHTFHTTGGVDRTLKGDRCSYFEAVHRNKRGIALDLKQPEGVEVVYKLVAEADVFIQNFRHGAADRLGLGYDRLREINPKLVYASGSGYGSLGPDASMPSLDTAGQARSGLMYASVSDGADPHPIQGAIADQMGGITLAWGILAALVARSIHGTGQKVEASHLGSSMWLQGLAVSVRLLTKHKPNSPLNFSSSLSREHEYNPLANHYRCKDGRWIMMANLEADRYWPSLAHALDLDELVEDARFRDTASRAENRAELIHILDAKFSERSYAEWESHLRNSGDFIFAPVQRLSELEDDPQVVANEYITQLDHPVLGPVKLAAHPIRYSETPATIRTVAPELGEHTEEVLLELGYSWRHNRPAGQGRHPVGPF